MIITGIDIGIKNMSYCTIDTLPNLRIINWQVVDLLDLSEIEVPCNKLTLLQIHEIAEKCFVHVFPIAVYGNHVIAIESQPMGKHSSNQMVLLSHLLLSYFRRSLMDGNAYLQSPRLKYNKGWISQFNLVKKSSYRSRKLLSIDLMKHLCRLFGIHDSIPVHTKMDDLADSFLLAMVAGVQKDQVIVDPKKKKTIHWEKKIHVD